MIEVFTIPEFAKKSRSSRSQIYEAIRAGQLVARKRGARTVILGPEGDEYLQSLPKLEPAAAHTNPAVA